MVYVWYLNTALKYMYLSGKKHILAETPDFDMIT